MNPNDPKQDDSSAGRGLAINDGAVANARRAGRFAASFLSRLPGADIAQEQLRKAEKALFATLKDRMERAAEDESAAGEGAAAGNGAKAPRKPKVERTYMLPLPQPPSRMFADLLQQAVDQSKPQAYDYLFAAILRELVPDEARIISFLSDGARHALVQLHSGTLLGSAQSRTLMMENVNAVAKNAGASLHESGHYYIGRLKRLGLIEFGPEDPQLLVQYQLLENSSEMRQTIASIESRPRQRAKITRETLRLSVTGQQLWRACGGVSMQPKLSGPSAPKADSR
ncbi:Abi-alpha family protein [Solimonas sp. K1W22B-7]|uniref:Abi-alpha family protein n=1 Tax=Solimonas sp. K1W22B-7 TaxID=2303331 RepID=UPI0013C429E4|nr:Abi-alpha family protein [Solimonas sp. K1W22B-7]